MGQILHRDTGEVLFEYRGPLRKADLSGAKLSFASMQGADLRDADLTRADLREADLRANLTGANLTGADLTWAELREADLRGANLTGADVRGAKLTGATLSDDTILPSGDRWDVYCKEKVPALMTAGGVPLEKVVEAWDCHLWENCPLHVAFGVLEIHDVPAEHLSAANQFLLLFDAELIPKPVVEKTAA